MEDTEASAEDIRARFGARVAALVAAETEDKRPGQPAADTWRLRKEESLRELAEAEDPGVKILWLADKLSNIRAIERDVKAQGDCFWNRFNQKDPLMHAWYYMSIAEILESDPKLKDTQACREYVNRGKNVFGKNPKN